MKNNKFIFGYFIFVYKIILVLAVFKLFGWCEVVPDNLITTSFIVVTTVELIAIAYDGLTRGILALIGRMRITKDGINLTNQLKIPK